MTAALPRHLTKYVEQPDGCWLWTGTRSRDGYGKAGGGGALAHRLVYVALTGIGLGGFTLHHTCRVRHCVNPAHLEPLTHSEHMRLDHPRRTHCKRGHEFDDATTYVSPDGKRECRVCRRVVDKARYYRQQEKVRHQ